MRLIGNCIKVEKYFGMSLVMGVVSLFFKLGKVRFFFWRGRLYNCNISLFGGGGFMYVYFLCFCVYGFGMVNICGYIVLGCLDMRVMNISGDFMVIYDIFY